MRTVVWSDDALDDFDRAIGYIGAHDTDAATLVADRIDNAAERLGRMAVGRPGRVQGTYEKVVLKTPYIIAYALSDREVTILRVLHGSRDWPEGAWPDDDPPADRG